MSKTIKIRVTDPTIVNGAHAPVDSIHTLDEGVALLVIGAGRAMRHVEELAAPIVEDAAAKPEGETAAVSKPSRRRAAAKPEGETAD